jgi:hypothetical protein
MSDNKKYNIERNNSLFGGKTNIDRSNASLLEIIENQ